MLDDWQASRLPLPKGWPERVRSAVVHAISIAQFSIVYTRSWAANNRNARIRLKTENDRLRQEVALLTEEMRIKDARMLRIPAQRRPHYPPTERLAILELRAARNWKPRLPSWSTGFHRVGSVALGWGNHGLAPDRGLVVIRRRPDMFRSQRRLRRARRVCSLTGTTWASERQGDHWPHIVIHVNRDMRRTLALSIGI